MIFATDKARQRGLPRGYVVIEESGSDEDYVLDCNHSDVGDDAPVRVWRPGMSGALETLAEGFGAYLLQAATRATT